MFLVGYLEIYELISREIYSDFMGLFGVNQLNNSQDIWPIPVYLECII